MHRAFVCKIQLRVQLPEPCFSEWYVLGPTEPNKYSDIDTTYICYDLLARSTAFAEWAQCLLRKNVFWWRQWQCQPLRCFGYLQKIPRVIRNLLFFTAISLRRRNIFQDMEPLCSEVKWTTKTFISGVTMEFVEFFWLPLLSLTSSVLSSLCEKWTSMYS